VPDSFLIATLSGQAVLQERMDDTASCAFPRRARDHQARAEAFLMLASRHVVAVRRVLVAELEHSGDHGQAQLMVRECHALQLSMLRAKGRLYGSSQLAALPWRSVWSQVVDHFDPLTSLERDAIDAVSRRVSPDALEKLAERMHRAEMRARTRPHPFIPRKVGEGGSRRGVLAHRWLLGRPRGALLAVPLPARCTLTHGSLPGPTGRLRAPAKCHRSRGAGRSDQSVTPIGGEHLITQRRM